MTSLLHVSLDEAARVAASVPVPATARASAGTIAMFVLNPVSQDRRVLKEASTLRAAGYDVTIIGIQLAKQPRPPMERTADGVTIIRVPISMAPEPWRPSPRYFSSRRARLRLAVQRARRRAKRRLDIIRLAVRRLRHRSARFARSRARKAWHGSRLATRRQAHRVRRSLSAWRRNPAGRMRREGRLFKGRARRARARMVRSARRVMRKGRRLRRSATRAAIRGNRFLREPSTRARVRSRWRVRARRMARRFGREFAPHLPATGHSEPFRSLVAQEAREFGRGFLAVASFPYQAAFAVWAAAYLGVNALTSGQLDWLLNTRYRWTTFSHRAAAVAPPAQVYHGHDFSGIGAALRARRRHAMGEVIYDSHEVYIEAGSIGNRSAVVKRMLRIIEGRAYRESSALVTVNQMVADVLHDRYGEQRTILVHNCPPRWSPGDVWPDLIREARDIPSTAPIALYQGAFTSVRGLRQMASALLLPKVAHVHLAFLGFGPMVEEVRRWAMDPRYGGRLHVLPPVEPYDLDRWVASADVNLMPNLPETLNEIVSTPNKLFESLAAGVPVVTSDFPERRRIVLEDPLGPLGAVCDPTDPGSIADAIVAIVGTEGSDAKMREAVRRRCLRAAHERWNWETESARLVDLYRSLEDSAPAGVQAVGRTS